MMLQPLCRRDKLMVWDDLMELLRVELKHRQTYLYTCIGLRSCMSMYIQIIEHMHSSIHPFVYTCIQTYTCINAWAPINWVYALEYF